MRDEFANRQTMHRTVLKVLDKHRVVWENEKPTAFTVLAGEFATQTEDWRL